MTDGARFARDVSGSGAIAWPAIAAPLGALGAMAGSRASVTALRRRGHASLGRRIAPARWRSLLADYGAC
ncbi:MAG: hypothetical protein MZV49_18540 [Rhodopseudomonas palustris]|nr:hypothetical protein [Rhodopseudomonas palustris]